MLSVEQCIHATRNTTFNTKWLPSDGPMTAKDIQVLADYIKKNPLTELSFELDITEENAAALKMLSDVIEDKSELTHLRVKINEFYFERNYPDWPILRYFDNRRLDRMTNQVFDAVLDMTRTRSALTHLEVNLEPIDSELSSAQTTQLGKNLRSLPLKHLSLNLGLAKDASFPVLSRPNSDLVDLSLTNCCYGSDLLTNLEFTKGLQSLTIDGLEFSASDLFSLDKILRQNSGLTALTLTNTNIGKIDSNLLFDRLIQGPKLKDLVLSNNNFNWANISTLCDYLTNDSCTLTELNLSGNTFMADDIKKIALSLTCSKLEKLVINNTYIEDNGVQALIDLLKANKHITSVDFSHCCRFKLSDATIHALVAYLKDTHCALKELFFDQALSPEQLQMVGDAIVANHSLVQVSLNYHSAEEQGKKIQALVEQQLFSNAHPNASASSDVIETVQTNAPAAATSTTTKGATGCMFFTKNSQGKSSQGADAQHFARLG